MTGRDWTPIAPGVLLTHAAPYRTSSVVLRRESGAGLELVLIDPAWLPEELDALAADVPTWDARVVAGFATHAHFDHVLWHPGFGGAPRWASPGAAALAAKEAEANVNAAAGSGLAARTDLLDLVGGIEPLPPDSGFESWAAVVVHDAHSTGHAALWLAEHRLLIAGDMLSEREIPMLAETGLEAYLRGLDTLHSYVQQAALLIPGHGDPTDQPMRRWEADLRYIEALSTGTASKDPRLADAENAHQHRLNLDSLKG